MAVLEVHGSQNWQGMLRRLHGWGGEWAEGAVKDS